MFATKNVVTEKQVANYLKTAVEQALTTRAKSRGAFNLTGDIFAAHELNDALAALQMRVMELRASADTLCVVLHVQRGLEALGASCDAGWFYAYFTCSDWGSAYVSDCDGVELEDAQFEHVLTM